MPKSSLEKQVEFLNQVAYRGSRSWGTKVLVSSSEIIGHDYSPEVVAKIIDKLNGIPEVEPDPVPLEEVITEEGNKDVD